MVQASGEDFNDQNVPVGTVVSRRVVSSIPEGMAEGAQPGPGAPMNPQQVACSLILASLATAGIRLAKAGLRLVI